MEASLLASLVLYSFVCTATPGPNNLMLATSGLAFGLRRTVPHMLGISLGCGALLVLCGLGLGAVFDAAPALRWLLRVAGALYLLWLAWKLWNATEMTRKEDGEPLGMWQAAAFQFVNPKAWAISIPAIATFTVPNRLLSAQLAIIVLTFVMVALPANAAWVALGAGARELLDSPRAMANFVRAMSVLTGLTAVLFLI
jgi:threonine/homoserine/homoserine lactone efflux protein